MFSDDTHDYYNYYDDDDDVVVAVDDDDHDKQTSFEAMLLVLTPHVHCTHYFSLFCVYFPLNLILKFS